MWDKIKALFGKGAPVTARPVRLQQVKPISERELLERLKAAPGSPLWEAAMLIIEEHIVNQMNAAMNQELNDRDHRWHLAAADALATLRDDLRERERQAREEREAPQTKTA